MTRKWKDRFPLAAILMLSALHPGCIFCREIESRLTLLEDSRRCIIETTYYGLGDTTGAHQLVTAWQDARRTWLDECECVATRTDLWLQDSVLIGLERDSCQDVRKTGYFWQIRSGENPYRVYVRHPKGYATSLISTNGTVSTNRNAEEVVSWPKNTREFSYRVGYRPLPQLSNTGGTEGRAR